MRMPFHLSEALVALAIFVGSAVSAISAVKLAVWGTEDQRDFTACLIAEISRNPNDYTVLERELLERVVAEAGLQAQGVTLAKSLEVGRLSGASGVLWVEGGNIGGRQVVITRLCAAVSGVVVGWQIDDGPLPDPEGWSRIMAKRVASWRAKLDIPRARAVALSIVDIRGAADSEKSDQSAQTLRTLLGSRLTAEPELFVLERWRLEELAWENVLGGNPFPEFWKGARLLDGSVTDAGGQLELSMRLRASGGNELRWTRRSSDGNLMQLVTEVTADVLERLAAGEALGAWDPQSESKEFFAEAEWAARWGFDARALQASEAAIALGLDSVAVQRLRYLACSRLAGKAVGEPTRMNMNSSLGISLPVTVMPKGTTIEQSLRAMMLFNDLRNSPAGVELSSNPPNSFSAKSVPALRDSVELLRDASRILWRAYFAMPSETAGTALPEVIQLRGEARELFNREFSWIEKDFKPHLADRVPLVDRGGRIWTDGLNTLPLTGLVWGSLWAESSTDHEVLVKKLISSHPVNHQRFYDDISQIISSGTGIWEVDWKTHDASRAIANWESFYQSLLKEQSLCSQVAAAIWLLSPSTKLAVEGRPLNIAAQPEEFWAPFVNHLGAIDDGRLPAEYFNEMLIQAGAKIPLPVHDKLVENLAGLLTSSGVISVSLLRLTYDLPLYPRHKDRLSAVLKQKISSSGPEILGQGIDRQNIFACLKKLGVETGEVLSPPVTLPNPVKPTVRQSSVDARAAWLGPGGQNIRWVSLIEDQLWLVTAPPSGGYTLRKVVLPDLKVEEVLSWQSEQPGEVGYADDFPAFALVDGAIYSWEGETLCRRRIDGGQRETIPLPITRRPNLWVANGKLYLGLDSGGVLRVDPETKAWELLADSKRRPAQGLLDDCAPYGVEHIWQDPRRGLCVMIDSILSFDEKSREWSGSRRVDYMNYRNPFDRKQALESLYDTANTRGQDRSFTVDLLFGDVDRIGAIHARRLDPATYFGGHPPLENGLTQWNLIGYMAEKGDLWALFSYISKPDGSPHLVWMPELPAQTVAIEVRFPQEELGRILFDSDSNHALQGRYGLGEKVRIISSRHGLAFYAVGFPVLWFISGEDLATAGVIRETE